MYAVSQGFMEALRADLRRVKCKVTVDYTDPFLDQSITAEANEQARISWPGQTTDGQSVVPYYWAALDGTWTAGAGRHPMPDTATMAKLYQVGWWGRQAAGAGGVFATPYPTLTVSHVPRPLHSLRVVGDSARGEYPVDFVIQLRDSAKAVLHTETVTGNSAVEWTKALSSPVLQVASQELEIRKWSHAGRVAKVVDFFTSVQETYSDDQLISVRLLEETDAGQGAVAIASANEVTVGMSNEDRRFDVDNDHSPLYQLIKPNRRLRVWIGAEVGGVDEWVPLGTYWAVEWDSPDEALEAIVRARDRLELMRTSQHKGGQVQRYVTLRQLAEQVLSDAGLEAGEYIIDPDLEDIVVPWVWFPLGSHRDALQTIAEAGLAAVWADRDGKVHVEQLDVAPGESVLTITDDDYFPPLRTPSYQEQTVNQATVATQPMQPAKIEVQSGEAATFTRDSAATNPDTGATVTANTPRFVQGRFGGKAVLVEEATTNRLSSDTATLEGGLGDWTAGAGVTIARVQDSWPGRVGSWSLRVSNATSGAQSAKFPVQLNTGVTRTASVLIHAPTAMTIGTDFYGNRIEYVPLQAGETRRIVRTWTADFNSNVATFRIWNNTGALFYCDQAQYEEKPYATSFIDGTRAGESVIVPITEALDPTVGTIEGWILLNDKIVQGLGWSSFFTHVNGTWPANATYLARMSGAEQKFRVRFNSLSTEAASPFTLVTGEWLHFAYRWNSERITVHFNGQLLTEMANTAPNIQFADSIRIGSYASDSEILCTRMSNLRLHRRALSDDEIAAHANAPVWDDAMAWAFDGDLNARTAAPEEVYRSAVPVSVSAGQSVTITATYSQPPVINAAAALIGAPAEVSITGVAYYAWGAVVTVANGSAANAAVMLSVTGIRLATSGGTRAIAHDEQSITAHGPLSYEYPSNPLVQTATHAQSLADRLLVMAAEPTRGVELEWRGNPALEVGDTVTVVTDSKHDRRSDYRIVRQELQWAGALSATLTGRRITG